MVVRNGHLSQLLRGDEVNQLLLDDFLSPGRAREAVDKMVAVNLSQHGTVTAAKILYC